jgi:hypothetical protein
MKSRVADITPVLAGEEDFSKTLLNETPSYRLVMSRPVSAHERVWSAGSLPEHTVAGIEYFGQLGTAHGSWDVFTATTLGSLDSTLDITPSSILFRHRQAISHVVWVSGYIGKGAADPSYSLVGAQGYAAKPPATTLINQLRAATSLPVSRLADLLMVSRRTLYNWLSGAVVSPDRYERVTELHHRLIPLARYWQPSRVHHWLEYGSPSPLDLAERGDQGELFRVLDEALQHPGSELLESKRIDFQVDLPPGEPVQALEHGQRQAVLSALRIQRSPIGRVGQRAIELADSYSPADEDET